ncbi:ATP-, maltotriose-and DNA-dependent transcriptional regulator MalT [Geodermatophilus ruber]|uniref:ATP-, maltotriose-and DNA-dependent transcriptional regulator MalT n=1 Tax=Geodermatophilus ruber TaxID=504800 RepID=A0A1I4BIL1_9ACTN|nr:ATP-, maltotriose-and DNA-dependent transcriptional regulator MalT [Geodermatophilus ruber]
MAAAVPQPRSGPGPRPPWPTEAGLRRGRLLDLLQRPARLVLVVAPAGYGKTTLLTQLAAVRRTGVAWLRVTHEDTDPGHLLHSLSDALLRTGTPIGRTGDREDLLRGLERTPEQLTLVVDDTQLIIGSPGEAELERLLTGGPPSFSAVLASRRMPALNLCRAELGQPVVVSGDHLRFRSWEVEELFRDFYGEPLPPDDIAALTRRTDGWAACLQLFHLSTLSRPLVERRRAVAALAGGARLARTYLARTVLDELPAHLRDFLARTSVFEVVTAARCDQLLGTTGSQADLDQLEHLGALTSSDDDGRTFRYHEVLRRHLESALRERLGAEEADCWYGRAAEVLEAEGASGEAVRACLRAGRWDRATQLLRRAGRQVIDTEAGPRWDDVLPAELVDEDPWLSTAVARRLAVSGRLQAAAGRYRRAEQLFPDPVDRQRTSRERRLVELWTDGRPQPHLHWLDRVRDAVARSPGASPAVPGRGPGDRLAAAMTALLRGDLAAAGGPLQEVLSEAWDDGPGPASSGQGLVHLGARLLHALVAVAAGASVDVEVDRIAADAERLGATWFVRQARVLRGLQSRDRDQLTRIGAECRAVGDDWGGLLADGAGAVAGLTHGWSPPGLFEELAGRCDERGAGTLRAWILTLAALGAAAHGAADAAAAVRRADAASRAAGVRGAQALVALAGAGTERDPGRAVAEARAAAVRLGIPWPEWLAARVAGHVGAGGSPAVATAAVRQRDGTEHGRTAPVELRCLGSFELSVAGRVVDWSGVRPRAASAFRLLALHTPRTVHRDTLLQLWPGRAGEQATHSLQVAVSSVRSLLAPDGPRGASRLVERRGEGYALVLPPGSTVDVVAFDTALSEAERARAGRRRPEEVAALRRAVAQYRGELLPEEGAAEWVVRERDRMRVRAARACARLAGLHLAAGELAAGVTAARRGVEIDPFADESWRLLISAYDRHGDSAAAARARREYAEVLDDLGVPAARASPSPAV